MTLPYPQRPVFQMRLGLSAQSQVGWVFPGEEEKNGGSHYSPAFTIAWRPDVSFKDAEYVVPGEIKGEYAHFHFRFDAGIFVLRLKGSLIRLAMLDPFAPQDPRGLPFYRVFPYLGKNAGVLEYYDKSDFHSFMPLVPLDLLEMDRLYIESRMVFVGVTPTFGPHRETRKPITVS